MTWKVAPGRLELLADCIVCHLRDGARTVVCTIARQVLRDLGDFQLGRRVSDEAIFSECLSEIERLATVKIGSRGVNENGELSIGTADLVRYGFGGNCRFQLAAE